MSGPRILVACIGNIFMGDDAFGVEVAQQLLQHKMPEGVKVVDFGIRGMDLAYALMDGYDATIMVDTTQRGQPPGTLYVIEPDLDHLDALEGQMIETHGMHPLKVLGMVKAMGGAPNRLLLVGCEPETFGPEEGAMGLSEPVQSAVTEAIPLIESLVNQIVGESRAGAQT